MPNTHIYTPNTQANTYSHDLNACTLLRKTHMHTKHRHAHKTRGVAMPTNGWDGRSGSMQCGGDTQGRHGSDHRVPGDQFVMGVDQYKKTRQK